jgi:hypothetical protein
MMAMQTQAIAKAQTSVPGTNWLHEHNVRASRAVRRPYPVQPTVDSMMAEARKAHGAGASAVPGFVLADDED